MTTINPRPKSRFNFKTPYNTKPATPEDYTGAKSQTVPDQTMPMRDMLIRFNNGQSLEIGKRGYYDESESPDPRTMDLAELQEEAEQLFDKIQSLREAEAERAKAAQKSAE